MAFDLLFAEHSPCSRLFYLFCEAEAFSICRGYSGTQGNPISSQRDLGSPRRELLSLVWVQKLKESRECPLDSSRVLTHFWSLKFRIHCCVPEPGKERAWLAARRDRGPACPRTRSLPRPGSSAEEPPPTTRPISREWRAPPRWGSEPSASTKATCWPDPGARTRIFRLLALAPTSGRPPKSPPETLERSLSSPATVSSLSPLRISLSREKVRGRTITKLLKVPILLSRGEAIGEAPVLVSY